MIKSFIDNLIISTAQAQESLPPVLGIPEGTGVTEQGDLFTFVSNIVRWSLGLIGMVLFIIILVAGFRYATAGDDSNKAQDSISTITNAVIGLFIVGLAFVLSNTVLGFIFSL
ncbi:MAG: Type secretion system pilin [Candidatus Parcubacteria bacterium]